jgi:monoamine oxidase
MPDPVDLSRRQALGLAAAAGLGLALPRGAARSASTSHQRQVVVVGAGLAGLTCALELTGLGWDVVVLEARDRVGGRVHTLWRPFGAGTHVEAGGEFIDRDHSAVLGMLARFGLRTETRDRSQRLEVFWGGRRTDYDKRVDDPSGDLHHDIALVARATTRLANGINAQRPELSRHARALDSTSLADWADGLGMSPLGRAVWEAGWIASDYATTSKDMSLLFYAQQECFGSSNDNAVEALRVAGGNALLPEAMAAHLTPSRVRLGEPVVSVRVRPGHAVVRTTSGTYEGAHVVVASPPPTLRAIHFDPALPLAIASAVRGPLLDPVTKVVVPYRGHPWRRAGWTGESLSDLSYTYSWDATDSRPGEPNGALVAFTGGAGGAELTALPPSQRVRVVEEQLGLAYPQAAGSVDGRYAPLTVAWADEPYTGGGYANYRPGQMLTAKPAFRRAYGPLRFAGEHTQPMGQYMESAVQSGRQVARAIGRP